MRKDMARPVEPISQDTIDEICERLANGESLRQILRDDKMPSRYKVYCHSEKDAELKSHIARAREVCGELDAEYLEEVNQLLLEGKIDPQTASVLSNNKKWAAGKKNRAYNDKAPGSSPDDALHITGNINAVVNVTGI